jgi:amino-acid N-acetyltransferase
MAVVIRQIPFDDRVAGLLRASGLPTDDLPSNCGVTFFGAEDGSFLGVVALETAAPSALLRSLAVASDARRSGLGAALLEHAEAAAANRGVKDLYLLTSTAQEYFAKRGYVAVDRAAAPASIAATRQFADLCPASSAFMVKRRVG